MTETVQQRIQSLEQHLSSQPRSPLFAQLAAYYLDTGKTREALDLCDKGLSHYPFFSTGHLIKGKVLLALNMPAEARREFEFVQSSFQGLTSLKQLLQNLPSAETETLVSRADDKPQPHAEPIEEPTSGRQIQTETTIEDSSPEQILSQFTEAASETVETELPGESDTAPGQPSESIGVEPAETFSPVSELPQESQTEISTQSEDVFGLSSQPAESEAAEEPQNAIFAPPLPEEQVGESFVDFAERKRGELFGLENSQSLDEYLAEQPTETTPEAAVELESAGTDPYATTAPESIEPQTEADPYATVAPESTDPQAAEDPFASLAVQSAEESVEPPPDQVSDDPFATMIQQPSEGSVEAPSEPTSEDPFAQLQQGFSTLPLQETPASDETAQERDQIADLADKLQNAKKITPIIDLSERSSTPPSESEAPSSTGFVTPTLAEIYAKQGWYDDAIKAYKTLALSKPAEKEKFENRILELQELKRQQESG